jgi:hypothetical protein
MSDVLDEVLEWNSLRDVQRALDFVHGIKPANPLGIRDRNRHSTFAPGREVAFRRRMQGVQSQPVFAERIAGFADSLRVAVPEMLRRAENFHGRKTRLRDLSEQR